MAHALLDAAAGWLRGRGRTAIRGPIDYSINYPCGLLVDGFDSPPRIMMNHNRPYYAGLLESWGLRKAKDLYGWWFVDPSQPGASGRHAPSGWHARGNIVDPPLPHRRLRRRSRPLPGRLQSPRCAINWGFVKLTDAEFHYFAKRLSNWRSAGPGVAGRSGRPAWSASRITLPDINEAIRPLNGRLTRFGLPVGLLRLLRRMRHIKTARMVVLDVLEEYRRRGIAELLIFRTLDYGKNVIGYTGAELGWTLEDNRCRQPHDRGRRRPALQNLPGVREGTYLTTRAGHLVGCVKRTTSDWRWCVSTHPTHWSLRADRQHDRVDIRPVAH